MAVESFLSDSISSIFYWEIAGYVASAFVVVGCAGEAVHEFSTWFKRNAWWNRSGGRASALLLIAALAAEIPIQVTSNIKSSFTIAIVAKQAAEARLAEAQLKETVAWRTISAQQLQVLATELAKNSGTVAIAYVLGDPETQLLASRIVDAFSTANKISNSLNWSGSLTGRSYNNNLYSGIIISGPETKKVAAIRAAFTAAQIAFDTDDLAISMPTTIFGQSIIGVPVPQSDAVVLVGVRTPFYANEKQDGTFDAIH